MDSFDIHSAPLETERKFLIEYPDIDALQRMPGYSVMHIEQTYLEQGSDLAGGRIRRITGDDRVYYVFTFKEKISELTRREYEREISEAEYRKLMERRAKGTATILKDRHVFRFEGLVYELDVYDFWDDRATLEAEVDSEDVSIPIPPCVKLIKEVTFDERYRNSSLARNNGVMA